MIMAAVMTITPAAETTIMAVVIIIPAVIIPAVMMAAVMMAAAIIPAEMTPVAIPGLMTAEAQIQEQVQKSNQETE